MAGRHDTAREFDEDYGFPSPTLNLVSHPSTLPPGNMDVLDGIDGRYKGELRSMPGFKFVVRGEPAEEEAAEMLGLYRIDGERNGVGEDGELEPAATYLAWGSKDGVEFFKPVTVLKKFGESVVLQGYIYLAHADQTIPRLIPGPSGDELPWDHLVFQDVLMFLYTEDGTTWKRKHLFWFGDGWAEKASQQDTSEYYDDSTDGNRTGRPTTGAHYIGHPNCILTDDGTGATHGQDIFEQGAMAIPFLSSKAELSVTVDRAFIIVSWTGEEFDSDTPVANQKPPFKLVIRHAQTDAEESAFTDMKYGMSPADIANNRVNRLRCWLGTPFVCHDWTFSAPRPNSATLINDPDGQLKDPPSSTDPEPGFGYTVRRKCAPLGKLSPIRPILSVQRNVSGSTSQYLRLSFKGSEWWKGMNWPFFGPGVEWPPRADFVDTTPDPVVLYTIGLEIDLQGYRTVQSGQLVTLEAASQGLLYLEVEAPVPVGHVNRAGQATFLLNLADSDADSDAALVAKADVLDSSELGYVDPPPDFTNIEVFDGITYASEGSLQSSTDTNLQYALSQLRWSPPLKDHPYSFNWTARRPFDDLTDEVIALVAGKDVLAAIGRNSILVAARSGARVAITGLNIPFGFAGRHAATVVGNMLFLMGNSAVLRIDLMNGTVTALEELQHLVDKKEEWADSLNKVYAGYDQRLGAVVFFNGEKQEAVFLWMTTGAITRMTHIPFTVMATGVEPNSGETRCMFAGRKLIAGLPSFNPKTQLYRVNSFNVHYIDATRTSSHMGVMAYYNQAEDVNPNPLRFPFTYNPEIIGPAFEVDPLHPGYYIIPTQNDFGTGFATIVTEGPPEPVQFNLLWFWLGTKVVVVRDGAYLEEFDLLQGLRDGSSVDPNNQTGIGTGEILVYSPGGPPKCQAGDLLCVSPIPYRAFMWSPNVAKNTIQFQRDVFQRKQMKSITTAFSLVAGTATKTVLKVVGHDENQVLDTKTVDTSVIYERMTKYFGAKFPVVRPAVENWYSNKDLSLIGLRAIGVLEATHRSYAVE